MFKRFQDSSTKLFSLTENLRKNTTTTTTTRLVHFISQYVLIISNKHNNFVITKEWNSKTETKILGQNKKALPNPQGVRSKRLLFYNFDVYFDILVRLNLPKSLIL